MNNPTLPQFENDYIISWDVSDKDYPCINIVKLRKDENGSRLVAECLGHSFEKTGTVSLRQLLESHDILKQAEAERDKERAELLKKKLHFKEPDGGIAYGKIAEEEAK